MDSLVSLAICASRAVILRVAFSFLSFFLHATWANADKCITLKVINLTSAVPGCKIPPHQYFSLKIVALLLGKTAESPFLSTGLPLNFIV